MSDDILGRIADWCAAESDIDFTDGSIAVGGDPPLAIEPVVDDDAVNLTHERRVEGASADFAEEAGALVGRRGSMIRGEVLSDADGTTVKLQYPIYLDGLNRQTFLLAIREITAMGDALDAAAASGAEDVAEAEPAQPDPVAVREAQPAPLVAEQPAAEPVSAEQPAAQPAAEPVASAQPAVQPAADTAPTMQMAAAQPWRPTHVVPGGGMSAWSEPDPALAPVASLSERVELRVDEMRGAWARVTGSNGWTGWVDGRRLLPAGGTAAAAAAPTTAAPAARSGTLGGLAIRPLPLVGGVAMIIAALLPWRSFLGTSANGFEFPLAVVWNKATPSQPRIGLVLVILGVAALVMSVAPRVPNAALVVVGLLGAACTVAFVIQLGRAVEFGNLLEFLGIGPWIAIGGGILTMFPGAGAR